MNQNTEVKEQEVISHGENIKDIRETYGMSQAELAFKMGMTQQAVSKFESKDKIEDKTLLKFAEVLGVSIEYIKMFKPKKGNNFFEFNAEVSGGNIGGNINDNDHNNTYNNPLDEILKLSKEKEQLYERLIANEKERNDQLMIHFDQLQNKITELENKINK